MGQISYFDVLFAAIILLSTVCAFFKGMAREIIGIGVVILGFTLAVLYYRSPAAKLAGFGCPETLAGLFGFLGIFLGCVLLGTAVALIIDRFLKAVKLKFVDKLLGAVFGFLRGWIISAVIVLALTAFPAQNSFTTRSLLVPYLLGSAGLMIYLTPDELKEKFEERSGRIFNYWNKGVYKL
ncbi:MAG: CvpA family protein [Acidobacteriota bacterium]|jgi:membrane protein required for colicin V production|nr:CvpA family protein [Acidobacteriota bacterium]